MSLTFLSQTPEKTARTITPTSVKVEDLKRVVFCTLEAHTSPKRGPRYAPGGPGCGPGGLRPLHLSDWTIHRVGDVPKHENV